MKPEFWQAAMDQVRFVRNLRDIETPHLYAELARRLPELEAVLRELEALHRRIPNYPAIWDEGLADAFYDEATTLYQTLEQAAAYEKEPKND